MSKSIRAIRAQLEEMRQGAETQKIKLSIIGGHSCYGVGVEQGVIDACNTLQDFLDDDDN